MELPSYQSFYHYITTQNMWESRWQCVLKVTRTFSILVKESANLSKNARVLMEHLSRNENDDSDDQLLWHLIPIRRQEFVMCWGRWHNPVAQSSNPRLWECHPSLHTSHLWWSVQSDPSSVPCVCLSCLVIHHKLPFRQWICVVQHEQAFALGLLALCLLFRNVDLAEAIILTFLDTKP